MEGIRARGWKLRMGAALLVAVVILALGPSAAVPTTASSHVEVDSGQVVRSTPGETQQAVARAGSPLSFAIAANDAEGDLLSYSASPLPPGATLDPVTGVFSWIPGFDQVGSYAIRFEVSDGALTDYEDITITVVDKARPPVLESIGDKTVAELETLEFVVSAADPNGDALTFSAHNLPTNASFDPATAHFSWTPVSGQAGTYSSVRFEVSDGTLTDYEEITIAVTAGTGDTTPPEIQGVAVSEVTGYTAVISWATDEPSTSQVQYWASPVRVATADIGLAVLHQVQLADLSPGTTYSFKAISVDGSGNLVESEIGSFTTPQDTLFSVDSLKIKPSRVAVGKKVTIRARVTNSGTASGDCTVVLRIDGITEATLVVPLAEGETAEVSFVATFNAAGTYAVNVNEASGSLAVREPTRKGGGGR
jgi:hypothetical protein